MLFSYLKIVRLRGRSSFCEFGALEEFCSLPSSLNAFFFYCNDYFYLYDKLIMKLSFVDKKKRGEEVCFVIIII